MICVECGATFEATKEVERLIELKKIPRVCERCAVPAPSILKSSRSLATLKRTKHSVLRRVDLFEPDGTSIRWLGLMPDYPKPGKKRKYRRGRVEDKIHTFVMSEQEDKHGNKPNTKIFTNIETFQRQGVPFHAWKAPGRVDALTGIDNIVLDHVCRIEDEGLLEVTLHAPDGSKVRLLYKN